MDRWMDRDRQAGRQIRWIDWIDWMNWKDLIGGLVGSQIERLVDR